MTRAHGSEEVGATEFLFDVEALELMDEAGVFGRGTSRVELMNGKLIKMAPIGNEHGEADGYLHRELWRAVSALDDRTLNVVHATVTLSAREAPIPDAMVARGPRTGRYYKASQALLVAEVRVSSLDDDLADKKISYAQAAIAEYWVLEPNGKVVYVFTDPHPDGFRSERKVVVGDRISPLFAEGRAEIAVADLFS